MRKASIVPAQFGVCIEKDTQCYATCKRFPLPCTGQVEFSSLTDGIDLRYNQSQEPTHFLRIVGPDAHVEQIRRRG